MKKTVILLVSIIMPLLCFAQGTVSKPTSPVNPHKKHSPAKPRINSSQTSASNAKLYIKGASFGNTKKDGTIIGSYGSAMNASDIHFLCCRLNYNGPSYSQTKTVYVKILKPNNELMTSSSSPSGYTYSCEVTFEPGDNHTVNVSGWGNEEGTAYTPGVYTVDFYFDGKKQYSSFVNLRKKEGEAGYLKVDNKTSVTASFGASKSSETFYVSTDAGSWTTWGVPSWCTVTDKTSTSFKLTCNSNTSSKARSDYMKVKAGSQEVRIDIKQEAGQGAEINKLWVDHNVYEDGVKGMRIHLDFVVRGLKGHTVRPIAYFYYSNGDALKDTDGSYCTTDGQVSVGKSDTSDYESCHWSDFVLFIPTGQLHLSSGKYDMKFVVKIVDKDTDTFIGSSEYYGFTVN